MFVIRAALQSPDSAQKTIVIACSTPKALKRGEFPLQLQANAWWLQRFLVRVEGERGLRENHLLRSQVSFVGAVGNLLLRNDTQRHAAAAQRHHLLLRNDTQRHTAAAQRHHPAHGRRSNSMHRKGKTGINRSTKSVDGFQLQSIWSNLVQFGPIWSNLVQLSSMQL